MATKPFSFQNKEGLVNKGTKLVFYDHNQFVYRHNVWQTSIRLAQSDDSDIENGAVNSSSVLATLNLSHNNVSFSCHLQTKHLYSVLSSDLVKNKHNFILFCRSSSMHLNGDGVFFHSVESPQAVQMVGFSISNHFDPVSRSILVRLSD